MKVTLRVWRQKDGNSEGNFEEYQAERVHAERRLETPETIERGFEKHEQRNSDHSQRNNRRDSVFGGTI